MRILDNIGLVQDPIHQGVDILEKLLNDLKSKLPFLNKKKVIDDEEESDEFDEKTNTDIESEGTDVSDVEDVELDDEDDKSLLTKLKKKFKGPGKSSAAPAGKGKKSNIIIICSLIIMAVLILPDMFEEEPIPTPVLKPRKRPTKKVQPTTETPSEAPSTVDVPTEGVETPPATTSTDLPPADETSAVSETPADSSTTTTTTTTDVTPPESPVDVTVTEPIGETVTEPTDSTAVDTTTVEPTTVEPTTSDTTPIDTTSIETPPTETTTPVIEENPSFDSIDGEVATGGDDNLTDQILKDLESQANTAPKKAAQTEYVRPPDYEYRGRGLVYNCVGKHWACIDGPSYKTCENNASANKYKNKPAECYPFNVYQSQNDCSKMQNRMVSSSAKTNFCQE